MIVVEVIIICIERITMNLIDVKSPADLKGLSISELTDLTAQARQALIQRSLNTAVILVHLWGSRNNYGLTLCI